MMRATPINGDLASDHAPSGGRSMSASSVSAERSLRCAGATFIAARICNVSLTKWFSLMRKERPLQYMTGRHESELANPARHGLVTPTGEMVQSGGGETGL